MTQFEQENDLGRGGGGEVDDETMDAAWRTAAERRSTANVEDDRSDVVPTRADEDEPQPWAKTSSGDVEPEGDEDDGT